MKPLHLVRFCRLLAALALGLVAAAAACAGPVAERVRASSVLRVCIWPDYYGVTYRSPPSA